MALVSMSEYARMRGISEGSVRHAAKNGKLNLSITRAKSATGKKQIVIIDSLVADKEWPRGDQEIAVQLLKTSDEVPPSKSSQESGQRSEKVDRADQLSQSYSQSRAVRETYNARLAKLSYEERSGTLVNAQEVQNEAFKIGRVIRDSLLSIPDRVSAELAAETNQFKLHARLTEEIRKALIGLKEAT